MKTRTLPGLFLLAALAAAGCGSDPSTDPARDRALLSVGVGIEDYDFLPGSRVFQMGLRHPEIGWRLRPFFGFDGTGHGAILVYLGVGRDVDITEGLVVTPEFAVGYHQPGRGKDLNHDLEFRSGGSLSLLLEDGFRVSLSMHHLSNSGLGEPNIGAEHIVLGVTVPLGRPSRRESPSR